MSGQRRSAILYQIFEEYKEYIDHIENAFDYAYKEQNGKIRISNLKRHIGRFEPSAIIYNELRQSTKYTGSTGIYSLPNLHLLSD